MLLTAEEKDRYQRQILLIGEENQKLLKQKTVLQVGAGGLGSPLAYYLISAGIGRLILIENDTLSLSNLGRQILYTTQEIGSSKATLAKSRLTALNPNVEIIIKEKWLDINNFKQILQDYKIDYIVDASDNFETKFLINDIGLDYNIPFTIAGIEGYEGQIISVDPHHTTCYRCVFGDIPKRENSAPLPILSPTCGVAGSIEAGEVIKGLINQGKRLTDCLLMVNLEFGDMTKIKLKPNPHCACGASKSRDK
ncbi:MAG: HesA/MoeB/ThiF family protein [Promethearchaeota archaeon]